MSKRIEPSGLNVAVAETAGLAELAQVLGIERGTAGQWFLRGKFPAARVLNVGPFFELPVVMRELEGDRVAAGIDWKAAKKRAASYVAD